MVARLGAKLEAQWSAFSKLYTRGAKKKTREEHGSKTLRAEFARMLVIDAALKGWQSGPLGYSSLVRTIPSSTLHISAPILAWRLHEVTTGTCSLLDSSTP